MARTHVKIRRNDWQISGLIDDAQVYSKPIGQVPAPPSTGSLPWEGEQERERAPVPEWFQPTQHADDREPRPDEDWGDVPILDQYIQVPDPSPNDQSAISALGIDALAYYAPFHFYQRNHWGIYVRDYGVAYLASQFLGRGLLTPSDNWILRCAYWLLYEHEYFHLQTEIAATRYEALTRDFETYKRLFHDGHASWLEEAMANACAYRRLQDHEDGTLTFARIESFRGFASGWMKKQDAGYRDFDQWCRSSGTMNKGRAAMTSRMHEGSTNHSKHVVDAGVIRPYENAVYSHVPVVRVHDSRIPWLRTARLFPKAHGIQVMVHTREHPPAHIHVEFLGSNKVVRIGWPCPSPPPGEPWPPLSSLPGEPHLSAREQRDLDAYLDIYREDIDRKVRTVFQPAALVDSL